MQLPSPRSKVCPVTPFLIESSDAVQPKILRCGKRMLFWRAPELCPAPIFELQDIGALAAGYGRLVV